MIRLWTAFFSMALVACGAFVSFKTTEALASQKPLRKRASQKRPDKKGATPEQIKMMLEENTRLYEQREKEKSLKPQKKNPLDDLLGPRGFRIRPYAEYSKQKYLIFDDNSHFLSQKIKERFLRNLPQGITPLIYTSRRSPEFLQSLKKTFSPFLKNPSRLKVVHFRNRGEKGGSFWSRDALPVPVLISSSQGQKGGKSPKTNLGVVDAKYYHKYEPDRAVAQFFKARHLSHPYYFEGGNFLATTDGVCAIVNKKVVQKIPDDVFKDFYGCKSLIRFPHLKGIGHIDESLKFVGDDLALTDIKAYQEILEDEGFNVILLPRSLNQYENYLNSIILKDVVYLPIFGNSSDDEAIAIYRNLGYKVVPINSYYLSNKGLGSLHCISMVYPDLSQFREEL